MILTIAEDFDGFKNIYSVVDIEEEPPRVVISFTTVEEAQNYIKTTPIKDTIL